MENCATCKYWRRSGIDGICYGGTPQPKIVEKGKECVTMWPRTNPDALCPAYKSNEERQIN